MHLPPIIFLVPPSCTNLFFWNEILFYSNNSTLSNCRNAVHKLAIEFFLYDRERIGKLINKRQIFIGLSEILKTTGFCIVNKCKRQKNKQTNKQTNKKTIKTYGLESSCSFTERCKSLFFSSSIRAGLYEASQPSLAGWFLLFSRPATYHTN